jgi:hypothetical protein
MSEIITFADFSRGKRLAASEPQDEAPKLDWRNRENIKADIDRHVAARRAYAKAVAWEIAAEDGNLPPPQIEEAKEQTARAYAEMDWAGRHLLICMPTDPRALVDLPLYLEKHFSVLPQEICGRSLAFELLHIVRLSLRKITKYGKYEGSRE